MRYLRHSFASWALALGEILTMIGKVPGHTQAQASARHAHLAPDSVRSAASRISRGLPRWRRDTGTPCTKAKQSVTGERIVALEAIGEMPREDPGKDARGREPDIGAARDRERHAEPRGERQTPERPADTGRGATGPGERTGPAPPAKQRKVPVRERGGSRGLDLGL